VENASGRPLASHFRLYRLHAPENEFFEAGDQVQFEGELPPHGLALRRLPAGEYRVACWRGWKGSPDPPPFTVEGEQTTVVLRLVVAPSAPAYLAIFDDNGVPLQEVDRRRTVHEPAGDSQPALDWVTWRAPKRGFLTTEGTLQFDADRGAEVEPLTRGFEGFALGRVQAPEKVEPHRRRVFLGLPGWTEVIVPLAWDGQFDPTWVAVMAPIEKVIDGLWLENGDRPDPELLRLAATSSAEPLGELPPLEPWSPLAIDVTAEYPGHKTLHLRWVPGEGPPADWILRRAD